MNKLLAFLSFVLCAGTTVAAQWTWSIANVDETFSTGIAYLLEIPSDSGITLGAIEEYIVNNGLVAPEESPVHSIGEANIGDDYGQWGISGATSTTPVIAGNSYFVIILNEDKTQFVISSTVIEGNPDPVFGNQDGFWGDYYSETPSDYWGALKTVGPVPEANSALVALLTISIGALRRRKKVA